VASPMPDDAPVMMMTLSLIMMFRCLIYVPATLAGLRISTR